MANPTIYTVGYGARTVDELIDALKQHGIEYLVDVRSQPYSKYNPEFSKSALQERIAQGGIRYVFMGDALGGRPNDRSCYVNGKVDYARLRETTFYRSGIERLHTALDKGLRLALMCSEGKPQECHRSKLIGETLVAENVEVLHIDETGAARTHADVIAELTHGQQSLFGPFEMGFKSRKNYEED
jgi:uncharacterized protein (DUF488 family)